MDELKKMNQPGRNGTVDDRLEWETPNLSIIEISETSMSGNSPNIFEDSYNQS